MSAVTAFALVCSLLPFLAAGQKCLTTMATIEGPYYKPDAPQRADQVICDYKKIVNGTQLHVQGRIFNAGCTKSVEALVDVWSADPQGVYTPKGPESKDYLCRGKVKTDKDGNYKFLTVIPGHYLDDDGYRPAHIHFKIFSQPEKPKAKPDLMTMIYFIGDPDIPTDSCPVKYCHAGDPTITFPLIPQPDKSYALRFDAVLGPPKEFYSDSDMFIYAH
jgi:protocatechuate 3,4-dioxygenase beta subunit